MKSAPEENPNPVVASSAAPAQTNPVPASAKPASSNVPGVPFPKIDSQRRAYFRIVAPNRNFMDAERFPLFFV
ncbi:MAG: hypothetical protein WBW41_10280, partial [Verrucomicrobiia bacterium]